MAYFSATTEDIYTKQKVTYSGGHWHKISIFQKLGQGHGLDLIFEKLSKMVDFSVTTEDIYMKQKAIYSESPRHKISIFQN